MSLTRFYRYGLFLLLSFPLLSFAQSDVGTAADNLTESSYVFSGVLSVMFNVIGIALFTAGIMRYFDFRRNSSQTPLYKPVILILAGIVVGFFPYIIEFLGRSFSARGL